MIADQIVVGIYLRYLPEELGSQVRDLPSDAGLETLDAAAKFAAAREDRRTTHLCCGILEVSPRRLATTNFPGLPPTNERLVEAMVERCTRLSRGQGRVGISGRSP